MQHLLSLKSICLHSLYAIEWQMKGGRKHLGGALSGHLDLTKRRVNKESGSRGFYDKKP